MTSKICYFFLCIFSQLKACLLKEYVYIAYILQHPHKSKARFLSYRCRILRYIMLYIVFTFKFITCILFIREDINFLMIIFIALHK